MRPHAIRFLFLSFLLISIAVPQAPAAWNSVVPGIDYQYFHLTSPRVNNIFVTRMDRTTTSVIVDASLANGHMGQPGSTWNAETIPSQAARYEGAFGFWGRETARYRYNVVAAINGNGFSTANGFPDSAMAMNGALIKRTFGPTSSEVANAMGFLYKLGSSAPTPGTPYMGGDLSLPADATKNRISFSDATWLRFHKLNDVPLSNAIVIYTHHFGARTPTTTGVTEIVVRTTNAAPLRILPWSNYLPGTAVAINSSSSGGTVIPFDGYVIVASGTAIAGLEAKVPSVGTEVRLSQETSDSGGTDWTNMYCALGPMWGVILRGGVKPTTTSDSYHVAIHPRTAVAYSAGYIYFIVVDGRNPGVSEGMTLSELADWCISEFSATDAVNNDGGGSSTMWVDGTVMNNPSDGSPRPVANGLMMIQLQPKETSTAFVADQTVYTNTPSSTLSLRTGPGTHFHVIQSLPNNTPLTIVDHTLKGLRAQNVGVNPGYWWFVRTSGGVEGWASQTYLSSVSVVEDWPLY